MRIAIELAALVADGALAEVADASLPGLTKSVSRIGRPGLRGPLVAGVPPGRLRGGQG